jgi:hypothetical protein
MTKENNDKRNENTDLIPDNALDTVETLLQVKKPNKKDKKLIKFHLLRLFGVPPQSAAKLSGYAKSYGYMLTKKYRNQPKIQQTLGRFIDGMPDDYRTLCKLRLPLVGELEGLALAEYAADPKLILSKPQILKQIKAGAGILSDEQQGSPQPVNINRIQIIMNQLHTGSEEQKAAIRAGFGFPAPGVPIDHEPVTDAEVLPTEDIIKE